MNDLSHKRAQRMIQQDRLNVQERAALINHLQWCDGCRRYASIHLHLIDNLRLEPVRTTATPEFRTAVLGRARYLDRRNRIMKPVQALAGVAILVIVLFLGWLVLRPVLTDEQQLSAVEPTVPPTLTSAPTVKAKPVAPAEGATFTTEVDNDILYATVDKANTRLEVHAPSDPGPWPVIVLVPGLNITRFNSTPLAKGLASRGAVVYNINVAFTENLLPGITRIACGVRFARATAADYGGDPRRITLVGSLGGASTGLLVALTGDDFEGDCIKNDEPAQIAAVVSYDDIFDYATSESYMSQINLKEENPDLWRKIDPYSHIGRNPDLQVRLISSNDSNKISAWVVNRQGIIDVHQALLDAGYDVTLTLLDGGFPTDSISPGTEAYKVVVDQAIESAYSP